MGRHLKQDGHEGMGMARAGMQEYIEHRHREAAREMGQWVLWAVSAAGDFNDAPRSDLQEGG